MLKLTPRQAEILAFIKRCLEDNGYPPTRAEIAQELGFKSPNAAEEHLKALARKGPAGANEALLQVLALAGHVIESRPSREYQARLAGLVDVLARLGQGIEAELFLGSGRELFDEGGHGRGTCGGGRGPAVDQASGVKS
jgi:predicted ArsR family transcriptional regulator